MIRTSSLFLAALAACGSSAASPHTGPRPTRTPGLLAGSDAEWRAVVVRGGQPYLFAELVDGFFATDHPDLALPSCWSNDQRSDAEGNCAVAVPDGHALQTQITAPLPKDLTVLGADGPCVAQVGALMAVDTAGCEPTTMLGAPLTGCAGPLAPVAHVGALDADLRWVPPQVTALAALDPAKLADAGARTQLERWLAEAPLAGSTRHTDSLVHAVADAGRERLDSLVAGYLIGDGADECAWETGTRERVALREGDAIRELAEVPSTWDGAIGWRGLVVGFVYGLPRNATLVDLEDGTAVERWSTRVWWDNEECTQGDTWGAIAYPCGP